MDEKFNIDRQPEISDARYEMLLKSQERKRNQIVGAVVFLGLVTIVAATVVLVVWRPWNG